MALPDQWVQKLFGRLEALYGNKMKVMWGEVAAEDIAEAWGEGLDGFEGKHIKSALEACLLAYVDFPPTLPQFIRLCKDARERERTAIPRLDSPPRSKAEIPASILEFIRKKSA